MLLPHTGTRRLHCLPLLLMLLTSWYAFLRYVKVWQHFDDCVRQWRHKQGERLCNVNLFEPHVKKGFGGGGLRSQLFEAVLNVGTSRDWTMCGSLFQLWCLQALNLKNAWWDFPCSCRLRNSECLTMTGNGNWPPIKWQSGRCVFAAPLIHPKITRALSLSLIAVL